MSSEEDNENITGWLKSQPPTGTWRFHGHAAAITVTALRDLAVFFAPSHQDDLDHLIDQLREQSNEYLRAIGSDPVKTCDGLGIQYGQVEPETIAALANGGIDDRHRDGDRGFKLWHMLITGIVGAALTLIVVAVSKYFVLTTVSLYPHRNRLLTFEFQTAHSCPQREFRR